MIDANVSFSILELVTLIPHMSYNYSAYGLRISSDIALPELPGIAPSIADVTVQVGMIALPPPPTNGDEDGATQVLSDGSYLYYYCGVGTFLIKNGCSIIIDPDAEADEPLLRLYLLGPAFGLLLHQRGELALHASAVCIDGGVVAFLGESGEGKSTLAAFLHRRGHPIVTDDVLVIRPDSTGVLMAHPGYGHMKLWPESLEAFGDNPDDLPQLHETFEKRFYRPVQGFTRSPLRLRQIYVLGEADVIGTTMMRPHEALLELVTNTYALRFVGSAGTTAHHFNQCATVAATMPLAYLGRPYSLDYLVDVAELVEDSMGQADGIQLLEKAL